LQHLGCLFLEMRLFCLLPDVPSHQNNTLYEKRNDNCNLKTSSRKGEALIGIIYLRIQDSTAALREYCYQRKCTTYYNLLLMCMCAAGEQTYTCHVVVLCV
jgi:hypothetical protein